MLSSNQFNKVSFAARVQRVVSISLALGAMLIIALPQVASAAPSKWDHILDWQRDTWDAHNDAPFRAIEGQIREELAHAPDPDNVILKYRALASKTPNDPVAQFRWGFSSFAASTRATDIYLLMNRMDGAYEAMALAKPPHSYEYTRVVFLVSPVGKPGRPAGLRLLARNPSDDDVKTLLLLDSCSYLPNDALMKELLTWAAQLVKNHPQYPYYRVLTGRIYSTMWWVTKKVKYAKLALAGYQDYLAHAPVTDGYQEQAHIVVKDLKKWLEEHPGN